MSNQNVPTYEDARLVLKLYELRREEKLRAAREWFVGKFFPQSGRRPRDPDTTPGIGEHLLPNGHVLLGHDGLLRRARGPERGSPAGFGGRDDPGLGEAREPSAAGSVEGSFLREPSSRTSSASSSPRLSRRSGSWRHAPADRAPARAGPRGGEGMKVRPAGIPRASRTWASRAEEVEARFERLQAKLKPLWKSIQAMSQDPQTIVVVPSMSLDAAAISGAQMQAYEERFLFLLLLLRQPRAELIYVTSQPIHPSVVDYYLDLLPGVISSHARRRLFLVAPEDSSPRPLSVKLLERPRLLERIRSLIPDRNRAHLVPYNTTSLELALALRLGIPMYGADPKFFPLGSKSGCRRLFAEEGVPHPDRHRGPLRVRRGRRRDRDAARAQARDARGHRQAERRASPARATRAWTCEDSRRPATAGERARIRERLRAMKFELPSLTYETYAAKFRERGGVVEELIAGEEFRSPSVQLRVTPLGEVELLSTHDQLLGGPGGQSYLGCRFPADGEYAPAITREAAKIGRRLAKEGVIGRFALDFVVVRSQGRRMGRRTRSS